MIVQLPDGNQAEFPDGMPHDQIETVLKNQFPSQSQPVPAPQYEVQTDENSPSWMTVGGKITNPNPENTKKDPGFLKTLDMLTTGVHRGVSHFTLGVMSMIPGGKNYQNAIKAADQDIENSQNKNIEEFNSYAPQIGEFGGELLATAPAGGLLGKIGSKAISVAKGGNLLGAYAGSGLAGAGVLSGTDAVKYQGEAFDPAKAAGTFASGMTSPLNYLAPMAGTAVGRYLDKSRDFSKAVNDTGIDVLPRDIKPDGVMKTLQGVFLEPLAALNPLGRRAQQLDNIGESIGNVIKGIAGTPEALSTKDYMNYAAKNLQMGLQKMQAKGTLLWEKGFKNAPVSNLDEISPLVNNAKELMQGIDLPASRHISKLLDTQLQKPNLTFGDVKELGTILGNAATDAFNQGAGSGADIGRKLSQIRKSILGSASGANLSKQDLADFKAAQAYSKNMFDLEDSVPLIKDAVTSQIQANKIVKGIIGDGLNFDKQAAMGIMSTKGQLAAKAARVSQSLANATTPNNGVNLGKFLKDVAVPENAVQTSTKASNTQSLLGDEYSYIQGMAKHLQSINDAKKLANTGKALIGGAVGGGAVLGATGNLPSMDSLAPVATYGAMLYAANHPGLKRLLGAGMRKLSPSVNDLVNSKVQDLFTRGGYIYNEDGSLGEKQ